MGAKLAKVSKEVADTMESFAWNDIEYRSRLLELRQLYHSMPADPIKQEQAINDLVSDMNNQKYFGLQFMPAVNDILSTHKSRKGSSMDFSNADIIEKIITNAARIVLRKDHMKPRINKEKSDEEKLAITLRQYIHEKIADMDHEELRFIISRCEEELAFRRDRLKELKEHKEQTKQLQEGLEKEKKVAEEENKAADKRTREHEAALAKERSQQRERLRYEEQQKRRWRELYAQQKEDTMQWKEERKKAELEDTLNSYDQGRKWKASFQNFVQVSRTTGNTIIREIGAPYRAKSIKPDKMGGSTYNVDNITFKPFTKELDLHGILKGELFEQSCCVDIEDLQISVPQIACITFKGTNYIAISKGVRDAKKSTLLQTKKLTPFHDLFLSWRFGEKKKAN